MKLNNFNIYSEQLFLIQFKVAHLVQEFPVFVYTEQLLLYSQVSMLMTNLDRYNRQEHRNPCLI
jgi:hypothetical protein